MNSCLSKLLRPSHRRILKISSSKMMTTHTRTLQGCEKTQTLSNTDRVVTELLNSPAIKNHDPSKMLTIPSFLPPSFFVEDDDFDDYDDYPAFLQMIPLLLNCVIPRFKSIENVISKLQSINLFESNPDSPHMFLVLLRLLSHAGKHDVLLDAYHHMVEYRDFVPNTYASNLLMDSLFTTGQSQSAFSVFKQIYSPDFFTFDIALFHLSNLNDISNISHVLKHMLRMPCYPSHDTFNKLLYSFCKMNAMPQVNQLLGLMVVKLGFEISANVWAVLVTKFVRVRSLIQIDAMISQGFVSDEEGTSAIQMQIHDTFCDLLYSVCKINAMPQAFQIFGLMVHNLGIDFSINVWTSLVTKFIQEGRSGALLNQMFSQGFLPDKGKSVAKVYAICDEVATAATSGVFQVCTLDYCDYRTSPLFSLQTEVHSRGLAT